MKPEQPAEVKLNACKCGGEPVTESAGLFDRIKCPACLVVTSWRGGKPFAANEWNTLNPAPAQVEICGEKCNCGCEGICNEPKGHIFPLHNYVTSNLPRDYQHSTPQPDERAEVEADLAGQIWIEYDTDIRSDCQRLARFILSREQPLQQRIEELEKEVISVRALSDDDSKIITKLTEEKQLLTANLAQLVKLWTDYDTSPRTNIEMLGVLRGRINDFITSLKTEPGKDL